MEVVIGIYIALGFVILVVATFVTLDLASGRRIARKESHDRLLWALGELLDAVEDGKVPIAPGSEPIIEEAEKVWDDEYRRVAK